MSDDFIDIFPFAVKEAELIHHALWAAFATCTII